MGLEKLKSLHERCRVYLPNRAFREIARYSLPEEARATILLDTAWRRSVGGVGEHERQNLYRFLREEKGKDPEKGVLELFESYFRDFDEYGRKPKNLDEEEAKGIPEFRRRVAEALDAENADRIREVNEALSKVYIANLGEQDAETLHRTCWALLSANNPPRNFLASMTATKYRLSNPDPDETLVKYDGKTAVQLPSVEDADMTFIWRGCIYQFYKRLEQLGYTTDEIGLLTANIFSGLFDSNTRLLLSMAQEKDKVDQFLTEAKEVLEDNDGTIKKTVEDLERRVEEAERLYKEATTQLGKLKKEAEGTGQEIGRLTEEDRVSRERLAGLEADMKSAWSLMEEIEEENRKLKRSKGDAEEGEPANAGRITLEGRYADLEENLAGSRWDKRYVTAILGKGTRNGKFSGSHRLTERTLVANSRGGFQEADAKEVNKTIKRLVSIGALLETEKRLSLNPTTSDIIDPHIRNYVSAMLEMRRKGEI